MLCFQQHPHPQTLLHLHPQILKAERTEPVSYTHLVIGGEKASQVKEFNSSDAFAIGDIVTNNKKLYKFIKAHTAGAWNASEAIEIGAAADADFLKLNDGWIKQINSGGHVYDASGENSMKLDIFYKTLQKLPNKYNNGKLRWLMSPKRAQEWELYLMNQVIGKGGAVPELSLIHI